MLISQARSLTIAQRISNMIRDVRALPAGR
jgi:hypothetical protein